MIIASSLLSGCGRYGFTPSSASRDGLSSGIDSGRDASVDAAKTADTGLDVDPDVNASADVSALDVSVDAGGSTILTLRTVSEGPATFNPSITKTGATLLWDFGDGSNVEKNSVSHVYSLTGEKIITVVSTDGVTGITGFTASKNALAGSIPAELGNLTNLTSLSLHTNQLSGSIPAELGDLKNLTYLGLDANQLSGAIPPELGNLADLVHLGLSYNQLNHIPAELGNLTNLTTLGLQFNQLGGDIPTGLGKLSLLTHLWLYSNQLSGAEPGALSGLVSLQALHLQDNGMSQQEVSAIIAEIYGARANYDNSIGKTLKIGGSNAAPDAAAMTQINVLETTYRWTITCTGC